MRKVLCSIFGLMLGVGLAYASDLEEGSKAYVKQDFTKAVQLYEKACNGGYVEGCYNLGLMYDTGEGVKQDSFKAFQLYEKACNDNIAGGCSNLGILYYKGEGVKQDSAKALGLFDKACQMKDESGCRNYEALKKFLGK